MAHRKQFTPEQVAHIRSIYCSGLANYDVIAVQMKVDPRRVRRLIEEEGWPRLPNGSFKNLAGKDFGRLTVVRQVERPAHVKQKLAYWECVCSCGGKAVVSSAQLNSGRTASCGCLVQKAGIAKRKPLTGKRFGSLIVGKRLGQQPSGALYECHCDCGNTCTANHGHLREGRRISCGCAGKGDDTVAGWLAGNFRNPENEAFFYVFTMANHPELSKPGIATTIEHRADEEYGELHDFIAAPRLDAWLIEQAVLLETRSHHDCPLALSDWPGFSELRKAEPELLFEIACRFHEQLQALGRAEFAIRFVPTTPEQREQLQAMQKATDFIPL